ncbi:MAG: ABC transporter permease [Deltaproteobacteria bacterium]|jgi:peptide/nickel transport system permease protein|nr:ABC transporter permease [Deltaproteobacteria bacterium]MBT4640854.1 ABC transporter permease [Deltaproteobacteria bacterium]MBT6502375.1 ABC transporter permease [Deltaproteobacteria bacterium]MBT7155874.1 ABC transporter permease [Deltaproteobacteria bacterium]MBT7711664.1 ABC transporter permease [Deltaproteobacteria bacterium]
MNHKSIVSGLNVRLLKAALGNSGFWGSFIVVIAILIALLAPQLSPNDPEALDTSIRFMPPSAEHWLGTDHMGRDVMSRLLWGARPSLKIGVGAVIIGLPLGIIVGLLSGFYRNTLIETVLMRTMEVLAAIPLLIWAIALIGLLGVKPIEVGPFLISNQFKIILVLGLLYVPGLSRIVYAVASGEVVSDYVAARRLQGVSDINLMISDILPNCMSPLIVMGTLFVANGVLTEAALSFLGIGVQLPQASWGGMLSEARRSLFTGEWWLLVFPGLAITISVTGYNLAGDALRDILDPRSVVGQRRVS